MREFYSSIRIQGITKIKKEREQEQEVIIQVCTPILLHDMILDIEKLRNYSQSRTSKEQKITMKELFPYTWPHLYYTWGPSNNPLGSISRGKVACVRHRTAPL